MAHFNELVHSLEDAVCIVRQSCLRFLRSDLQIDIASYLINDRTHRETCAGFLLQLGAHQQRKGKNGVPVTSMDCDRITE